MKRSSLRAVKRHSRKHGYTAVVVVNGVKKRIRVPNRHSAKAMAVHGSGSLAYADSIVKTLQ